MTALAEDLEAIFKHRIRFMLLTKGKVRGGMVEQELSDAQWKLIQPWLPAPKRRGRPRADDRRTINGVLYVLPTGCRWQVLPGE